MIVEPNPVDSARDVLKQAIALMMTVEDVAYATKLPGAFNASIGAHMRHCLDHFRCLLDGIEANEINYDARGRDPLIESVRLVALDVARDQLREIESLDPTGWNRPIRVCAKIAYGGDRSCFGDSSVGREVMFVVVHAVHHFALIGVMAGMLGLPIPESFGIAPSTIQNEENKLAA